MLSIEIVEHEQQKFVKATLAQDGIRAEAGALQYWRGDIEMTSRAPSAQRALNSLLTGERVFKPIYKGTGEVYFGPPRFGELEILQLDGDAWILDRGAYLCSDIGIEVDAHRNRAMSAFLGQESWFQTRVQGRGRVVVQAPGAIQRIELDGGTLAVNGALTVARTEGVDFHVQRATRSLVGTVTSGEGLINVYSGHGTVLISPVPNLYEALTLRVRAPVVMQKPGASPVQAGAAGVLMVGCLALMLPMMVVGFALVALMSQ